MWVYFHADLGFCTLLCTQSTVTNHLPTFSSVTPNLLQMLDSDFLESGDFQIWRQQEAELHKAASSLVASLFCCQPVNTTPCWPGGALVTGTCRNRETHTCCSSTAAVTHICSCPAPQGKAAADSGAPGANTGAVKHHPGANKLHSVPLTSGFHLCLCMKRIWFRVHMCTRWVF